MDMLSPSQRKRINELRTLLDKVLGNDHTITTQYAEYVGSYGEEEGRKRFFDNAETILRGSGLIS